MLDLSKIQALMPTFTIKSFIMFDEITSLSWNKIHDEYGEANRRLSLIMTSYKGFRIWLDFLNVEAFRFQGNGQTSIKVKEYD